MLEPAGSVLRRVRSPVLLSVHVCVCSPVCMCVHVCASVRERTHFPKHAPVHTQEAPSSGSVRTARGVPLLSESWLPRKDTWLMQLMPEAVRGPVYLGLWLHVPEGVS